MQHRKIGLFFAAPLCAVLALGACSNNDGSTPVASKELAGQGGGGSGENGGGGTMDAAPSADAGGGVISTASCSPGQAVAILLAANDVEIAEAQLAITKSSSADVKSFAQQMITDHTQFLQSFRNAFNDANITSMENDISGEIRSSSQLEMTALSSMSGSDFDASYLAHELLDHSMVLGALDNLVMGSVTVQPIAGLLQQFRAAVLGHVQLALTVQARVRGTCGSGNPSASDAGSGGSSDAGAAPDACEAGSSSTADAGSKGGGNTQQQSN